MRPLAPHARFCDVHESCGHESMLLLHTVSSCRLPSSAPSIQTIDVLIRRDLTMAAPNTTAMTNLILATLPVNADGQRPCQMGKSHSVESLGGVQYFLSSNANSDTINASCVACCIDRNLLGAGHKLDNLQTKKAKIFEEAEEIVWALCNEKADAWHGNIQRWGFPGDGRPGSKFCSPPGATVH